MIRIREFVRARLPELFGIDLRTLAVFRVALAAVTAVDLLHALADVRALYSDHGVLPRALLTGGGEASRLSLHLANGDAWFVAALLAIQLALVAMVLVGHRTRLASILTFVLLGSLHSRNPAVVFGADQLLLGLWFWAMFLPLGARWSCEAALSARPPPEGPLHLSWGSAGLTLQVLSMYFFSAAMKSGPEWWPQGSAVWYALSLDRYATPLGVALREGAPGLLTPLTWAIYWAEWIGPLLALSPVATRPLRFLVMIGFMLMHLGFLATLGLGHFPLASLTGLTALLGGWWWERAVARARHDRFLKIFYDEQCASCERTGVLLRHFLVLPRTELLPAQGSVRARTLMEAQRSWVVIDGEDVAHTRWQVVVALLRHSLLFGWAWRFAALPIWERAGNAVYDRLAARRRSRARLPPPADAGPPRAVAFEAGRRAQRIAAVFLFLLLAWHLAGVGALPAAVARVEAPLLQLLRLDQAWNMLAPRPDRDDGWFVAPARLADGSEADLLRPGEPLSYLKPAQVSVTHEAPIRWRTYRDRLDDGTAPAYAEAYARFLCREWNARPADAPRALSMRLVFMLERSPPPGQAPAEVEQRVLWRQDCAAD